MTDPQFTPDAVLAAAFAGHDFLIERDGQSYTIQTSEPFTEGGQTLIEVSAMTNPIEEGVTYRYRVTFDREVTDEELAAARAL